MSEQYYRQDLETWSAILEGSKAVIAGKGVPLDAMSSEAEWQGMGVDYKLTRMLRSDDGQRSAGFSYTLRSWGNDPACQDEGNFIVYTAPEGAIAFAKGPEAGRDDFVELHLLGALATALYQIEHDEKM